VFVSVLHFVDGTLQGLLGACIYLCLGLFSSLYHFTHHVQAEPDTKPHWKTLDLVSAYSAMFFNGWLFFNNPYAITKILGSVLCFSTLILYFMGSRAIERKDMKTYSIIHSLWHWFGALGALLIFL